MMKHEHFETGEAAVSDEAPGYGDVPGYGEASGSGEGSASIVARAARPAARLAFCLLLTVLVYPGVAPRALADAAAAQAASAWQSVESIRHAAEAYALAQVGHGRNPSVEAVGIDQRLRLSACSRPLDAASNGGFSNGRGTVIVSCTGAPAWRLFVPVRVSQPVGVLVARRALQRDELLSEADLEVIEQPAASLPYQYLTRLDEAVGTTLRRSVPAGAVLVPGALERPSLIDRGARVTLITGHSSIVVKAEGVALDSASLNGRVRVKTAAGRIVEGRAEALDLVRVGR